MQHLHNRNWSSYPTSCGVLNLPIHIIVRASSFSIGVQVLRIEASESFTPQLQRTQQTHIISSLLLKTVLAINSHLYAPVSAAPASRRQLPGTAWSCVAEIAAFSYSSASYSVSAAYPLSPGPMSGRDGNTREYPMLVNTVVVSY